MSQQRDSLGGCDEEAWGNVWCVIFLVWCGAGFAGEKIVLPAPERSGGKPLMQALNERRSSRAFSEKELPVALLSNLLWAANGVNHPEGKRTAPSAGDSREIDIYVAMQSGLYYYDPDQHVLVRVLDQDIREAAGIQDFTQTAPVNLIFTADLDQLSRYPDDSRVFYSAADAGFVSQNVYLFCASEGLATVVLGWVDKEALALKIGLKEHQKVILTQPVGFPAD
jgi:SagB-type dehydrogenase family enzyme